MTLAVESQFGLLDLLATQTRNTIYLQENQMAFPFASRELFTFGEHKVTVGRFRYIKLLLGSEAEKNKTKNKLFVSEPRCDSFYFIPLNLRTIKNVNVSKSPYLGLAIHF